MNRGRRPHEPALAERARELRANGAKYREIVAELGVPKSTVAEWCTDPDHSRAAERRERYTGKCVDCGARTYNGSMPPPERCMSCWNAFRIVWTEDAIVAAIRRFATRYGRAPTAIDFNPASARHRGLPERAEIFYADGDYPSVNTVQHVFGGWGAAVRAAGFECWAQGHYGRPGEDPAVVAETVALYQSGLSAGLVAERLGCSAEAVRHRLIRAGVKLRTGSEAQALRHQRERVAA